MKLSRNLKAFTLIELLIVVAIIAILAAIAVPNFLEAQTRAKVSRSFADMRTYATALESYFVDFNSYPICNNFGTPIPPITNLGGPRVLIDLTSPVAYLTQAAIPNPFQAPRRQSSATAQGVLTAPILANNTSDPAYQSYLFQSGNAAGRTARSATGPFNGPVTGTGRPTTWFLHSSGPDGIYFNLGGILSNPDAAGNALEHTINLIYDPTNGTVSYGGVWRAGGDASGFGRTMFQAINLSTR